MLFREDSIARAQHQAAGRRPGEAQLLGLDVALLAPVPEGDLPPLDDGLEQRHHRGVGRDLGAGGAGALRGRGHTHLQGPAGGVDPGQPHGRGGHGQRGCQCMHVVVCQGVVPGPFDGLSFVDIMRAVLLVCGCACHWVR